MKQKLKTALPGETRMQYHPKGGMCATCYLKGSNDCYKLDFKSMRVIAVEGSVSTVKCAEFKKEKKRFSYETGT